MILRIVSIVLLLLGSGLTAVGPAGAAGDDLRLLEGLRQRRLFELAEAQCQQLTRSELSDRAWAELTVELIRCYAEQAVHAPPEDRDRCWQLARSTAAEFLSSRPQAPRRLLVRVQDALTVLARGELYRQEAEVLSDPAAALDAARPALREATRLFQQLDQELTREIPQRHRQTLTGDQLSADELISLQHHVQAQLARAYKNQALCFPDESDDRIAALTGAVEQLKKPLLQVAEGDPLIWTLRLELAICYRLLGQAEPAETLLQQVEQSAASELQGRARAERARLQLDAGQAASALALLQAAGTASGPTPAELDLARLEVALALWQAAAANGDHDQAGSWRKRAVQMVERIEQNHGPYWGRRGDLLLVRAAGRWEVGGDVNILARAADDLYRQGQWSEAVGAYNQAAAAARAAGDTASAFQLRYKSALVHHTRQAHPAAAEALRQLAVDLRDQPAAAEVHLLAAWNAAQAARSTPEALEQYPEILREHLQLWPGSATADTARIWLGRFCESRGEWQAAAEAFQQVSADHEQHDPSLRDAARCWSRAFEQLAADQQAAAELAAAAAARFLQRTPAAAGGEQADWTPTARFCAAQAARWLIEYVPDGHPQAEAVLTAALNGSPPPDPAWQAEAAALLIVALAAQPGRSKAAEQRLREVADRSPAHLLDILRGLAPIMSAADDRLRQQLAGLQLEVTEQLWQQRERVEAEHLPLLQRARAEALVLTGCNDEARAAYAELAQQHPDDGAIQEAYAQLLLDAGDRASWQAALEAWRRIAARSQPQTDRWYQARYAIAAALIKLGQREEAASRIRYLQALPPGLENTPWQTPFQNLLQGCQR